MPKLHLLQTALNGGEVAPALRHRTDLAVSQTWLKEAANVIIHPQGGVSNRAGTQMLAQAKNAGVRLIPFEFSNDNTYILEFGANYIRFYTPQGQIITQDGVPYEISTPFAEADLSKINYYQIADVMYIAWGGKPQKLTRYGHTDWRLEEYAFKNGPYLPYDGKAKGKLIVTESSGTAEMLACDFGNNVYTSQNGTSWSLNPSLTTNNGKVIYANGQFLMQKEGAVHSSDNMQTWVRKGTVGETLHDILYANGYYVGYGDKKIWYSQDLQTWNSLYLLEEETEENINRISVTALAYLNGQWIASAREYVRQSYGEVHIWSAEVPTSWTHKSSITSASRAQAFYFLNNNYLLMLRSGGFIYYSANLLSWTQAKNGNTILNVLPSFFYVANGQAVGIVYNFTECYLTQSEDGINWTRCTNLPNNGASPCIPSSQEFSATYYNGNFYFAFDQQMMRGNTTDGFEEILNSSLPYLTVTVGHLDNVTGGQQLVSTDYVFKTDAVGRKFSLLKNFPSSAINKQFSGVMSDYAYSETKVAGGNWLLKTSGTWSGQINIEISKDGVNWETYRSYSSDRSSAKNYDISGSFEDTYLVRLSGKTETSGQNEFCMVDLSLGSFEEYVYMTGAEYVDENTLKVYLDEDSEILKDYLDEKESALRIGSWGGTEDWPTLVIGYQDRMGWGTKQTMDFSKISAYEDFAMSAVSADDDAISVVLSDQKMNKLTAVAEAGKLVLFTGTGNHVHNQTTFTPSTATFSKDSEEGAGEVAPVTARGSILYASVTRGLINDFNYDYQVDGYKGDDITLLAKHLFKNKKIKEMVYQAEPDSQLWVVLESGELLCCTYLKGENVKAWCHMQTQGKVLSACVLYDGAYQNLYLAVQRATGTFVEKMPTRLKSYEAKDQFFVDCGRTYEGEAATEITGLNYLEGQEVAVLADGNVQAKKTVQNGKITLDYAAQTVHVGLPYSAQIKTLPADVGYGDGTAQDRKRRIVAATVFFVDSRGGLMGTDNGILDPILQTQTQVYNGAAVLADYDKRMTLSGAYGKMPSLVIRQDDPLPITVTGFIQEMG